MHLSSAPVFGKSQQKISVYSFTKKLVSQKLRKKKRPVPLKKKTWCWNWAVSLKKFYLFTRHIQILFPQTAKNNQQKMLFQNRLFQNCFCQHSSTKLFQTFFLTVTFHGFLSFIYCASLSNLSSLLSLTPLHFLPSTHNVPLHKTSSDRNVPIPTETHF